MFLVHEHILRLQWNPSIRTLKRRVKSVWYTNRAFVYRTNVLPDRWYTAMCTLGNGTLTTEFLTEGCFKKIRFW